KGEEAGSRANEAESEAGEGRGNCPWLTGAVAEAEAVMIAGMTRRWRSTIAVRDNSHSHLSTSRASSTFRDNGDWFDKGEEAGSRANETESEAGERGGNCPWLIGALAEAEAAMIAGMTWRWRSTIAVRNSSHSHLSSSRPSSSRRYNDDWFGPARFIQTSNPALLWLGQARLSRTRPCFGRLVELLFHGLDRPAGFTNSPSPTASISLPQMRTIMARSPHESSFSFSKRHFQWIAGNGGEDKKRGEGRAEEDVLVFSAAISASPFSCDDDAPVKAEAAPPPARKKGSTSSSAAAVAVSRLRAVLTAAIVGRHRPVGLGPRVTGTLFGHRRGHVHFAFQVDPRACPAVLIELATPTNTLVREMASGLVRIALECERRAGGGKKLLEEPLWRAYCNGKKCGYAVRRECGPADWRVLRAVEPVSTGAGVLPGDGGAYGEMMYMRARFERVVGSKDSEAFYMMNPDNNGGPELSIYLLRV
ncbi:hypothetical protein GW17_00053004, partial [Ensete ventricosum]